MSTAVDLRAPWERARSPSPVQDWSAYHTRPVFDDAALACVEERFRDGSTGFSVWALESRPERIAAIFQTIADAPPGSLPASQETTTARQRHPLTGP